MQFLSCSFSLYYNGLMLALCTIVGFAVKPADAIITVPLPGDSSDDAIEKAIDYLIDQRGSDHLWHSPNYGNLREGAATSALVLYALSHNPDRLTNYQRSKLRETAQRLVVQSKKHGFIANRDGPDYSNYASAMFLVAIKNLEIEIDEQFKLRLLKYLQASQLNFDSAGVDQGGWDYSGWMTGERKTAGTNISVTCMVAECLRLYEQDVDTKNNFAQIRKWVRRVQADDGGFFFHPKRGHDGNKAGWRDPARKETRAYGTCTCDGIRLLVACEYPTNHSALKAAVRWSSDHIQIKRVPGFDNAQDRSWQKGLRFYYWQSLCKSLHYTPKIRNSTTILETLQTHITGLQKEDGRWENSSARMREDDPIIATSFALIALGEINRLLDN